MFGLETEERFDVIIIDSTDPSGPGEVLFSETFYRDCRRCLSERGLLITQNGVPFEQRQEFADSRRRFGKLFRYPNFYFAAVPTYVGGVMAFGCASNPSPSKIGLSKSCLCTRLKVNLRGAGRDSKIISPDWFTGASCAGSPNSRQSKVT